jgi:hypothetical protein
MFDEVAMKGDPVKKMRISFPAMKIWLAVDAEDRNSLAAELQAFRGLEEGREAYPLVAAEV